MTRADELLTQVYEELNILQASDIEKYSKINEIVSKLQIINNQESINAKTTGTISERLCELGLKTAVPEIYKKINDDWNWMADFSVLGHPFNLLISVKSFTAKERLIVSGSGNILSPTVGWGLFTDINEWTYSRVCYYLYRAFIAIYMPSNLYNQLSTDAQAVKNINGKPFLRINESFVTDLANSIQNQVLDITKF